MRRLWEAWLVWLLFGLTTVAVFVTYWRLPSTEFWKTTQGGLSLAWLAMLIVAALFCRTTFRPAAAAPGP